MVIYAIKEWYFLFKKGFALQNKDLKCIRWGFLAKGIDKAFEGLLENAKKKYAKIKEASNKIKNKWKKKRPQDVSNITSIKGAPSEFGGQSCKVI
jgi:hypothetical protein